MLSESMLFALAAEFRLFYSVMDKGWLCLCGRKNPYARNQPFGKSFWVPGGPTGKEC